MLVLDGWIVRKAQNCENYLLSIAWCLRARPQRCSVTSHRTSWHSPMRYRIQNKGTVNLNSTLSNFAEVRVTIFWH
ncbi:hypothetical protein K1T71_002857 [Dendrolimus kikuchii]|uniref:Uncharacterized protein n=1 Tax=Dendrolimus kikuchii TaxID=765133 RepID=A0ACC1DE85_9NEOP|nr:hypothetical protein K1T71_002857 [Dendrolimus kikuchii]